MYSSLYTGYFRSGEWKISSLCLFQRNTKGMFFGGDSYVILYTYHFHGREAHIIYFWQVSRLKPHKVWEKICVKW